MYAPLIIAGTDTDIGKTVFSAALMAALAGQGGSPSYWKPVQSGIEGGVDTRTVQKLSGLDDAHFLPEHYVLSEPLSPHRAAEIDGVQIDPDSLRLPEVDGHLVVELAGGLMVPLTRKHLQLNVVKQWNAPVILCARTELGTINHTLLSLEALWARDIPIKGLVFIGPENNDNVLTIGGLSQEKILGHLPYVEDLNAETLAHAFAANFNISDFV